MFEVGDSVICVRVGSLGGIERDSDIGVHLKVGKKYVVLETNKKSWSGGNSYVSRIFVEINSRDKRWCDIRRFVSLTEYRRLKLEKICSRLET